MKPSKSILDKSFPYTPAAQTDIGKRFKRIWAEQRKQAQAQHSEAQQPSRLLRRIV